MQSVAGCFGTLFGAADASDRAHVPFDFVVGEKVYPAGEYAVQTAKANTYYLSIKNEDKTTRELIDSYPCISSKPLTPGNQAKLVFHRVENTYFLHRVCVGGSTVGREFPKSHRETQMTMNGSTTETTIVAANIAR